MNLNQLEYFVAVAESLNFTKAADKCFITQTAMSQQIRSLEQTVGVPLLVRDKHHVELTPTGKVYLGEARAILARSSAAIRLARTTSEGIAGSLSIGFISGSAHDELAYLLRNFHKLYPKISISFYRDNMNGLYTALEQGKCDIAFNLTTHVNSQMQERFHHKYFASYPLKATVYQGHRLAEQESVRYTDLAGEDYIIMQPPGRSRDEAEEVLVLYDRGGFIPNIIAAEPEPETLFLMISSGLGISVLPEYLLRNHPLSRNLRVLPIVKDDGTFDTLDLEMIWEKESFNPAADRFLSFISEIV